jgi:hypothetical protein
VNYKLVLISVLSVAFAGNWQAHAQAHNPELSSGRKLTWTFESMPSIIDFDSITVPLKVHPKNPNYFTDGSGKAVCLTGSHTWNTLQDWGTNDSIRPLDFNDFIEFLLLHHHNFTLLWTTELPVFRALPTTKDSPPDFTVTPFPWERTGPGLASDGKPKFDLTKFNQAYFDRLRDRVSKLRNAGIYAGVYLFSGEWILRFRFPGDGYPFTGGNNINGIDDGGGMASVTMTSPGEITAVQDDYVEKVINTLNDLPNILWIVSQEAPSESVWWNKHLIAKIKEYESEKKFRHPVGLGWIDRDLKDSIIINSDADWIAPMSRISPVTTIGAGNPSRKVNINDSDHSYWEIWNDTPLQNRNYFWINFTQGNQTLFMDPYLVYYPRQNRNLPDSPLHGVGIRTDQRWENVRNTMGYIRDLANRMDLAAMTPNGILSSTGHVLANILPPHTELLIYSPSDGSFTVNLAEMKGKFDVNWMNPSDGTLIPDRNVKGGGLRTFTPPFRDDAVLYLKQIK